MNQTPFYYSPWTNGNKSFSVSKVRNIAKHELGEQKSTILPFLKFCSILITISFILSRLDGESDHKDSETHARVSETWQLLYYDHLPIFFSFFPVA